MFGTPFHVPEKLYSHCKERVLVLNMKRGCIIVLLIQGARRRVRLFLNPKADSAIWAVTF